VASDAFAVLLKRFAAHSPELIAETPIARIYKVTRHSGDYAALKAYKDGDMKNEAAGLEYLAALKGRSAVHIYKVEQGAALMEWLEGASLGDLARSGQDMAASKHLAEVAKSLHFPPPALNTSLPNLADIFEELLEFRCPSTWDQKLFHAAQSYARDLLRSAPAPTTLHGDLHHDNVLKSARGYCAIDAKGVIGERGYELANALRNPLGMAVEMREPQRLAAHTSIYATALDVPLGRFQKIAAVQCALSMVWRFDSKKAAPDPEGDLLEMLLAQISD
jgi:streptomycin 6-kinase